MIETMGTESIYSRELYKCVTTRYIYYMCNHITEEAKDATQKGQPQTAPNPTKPHKLQPTATTAQHRYTANHSDTITATATALPYSLISLHSHKTQHSLMLVIYRLGVEDR